jgi:SPP1 family predicted phage head-tail adaptor
VTLAAGDLSRLLRIQQRAAGTDSLNRPLTGWEDVVSLWAQPRGRTGMGVVRAEEQGVPADVSTNSFRVRYRPIGLHTGMRAVLIERLPNGDPHTTYYEITNIVHDRDRHEWTDIVCRAGASDG